jgi:prepilin-type processing-associated H-X9-DG protein
VHAMASVGSASSSRSSASKSNVVFVDSTVLAMALVGISSLSRVSASRANLLFVGGSAAHWRGS